MYFEAVHAHHEKSISFRLRNGNGKVCAMNNWGSPLASLVLLAVGADWASAQSQPGTVIGTCVVIQTNATSVETPLALRAVGSCETATGGTQNCTAEIVPTGADIILDVTDTDGVPGCLRLAGDDPCAVVQNGPVIFQSPRHATQSFSAASDRVRMTTMIRQKRVQQITADLPPSTRFPLHAGRLFDVLRNRSSVAVRLECAMADGDQRIFPIVGEADLSPNISFVAKNSSEPAFDILSYRVTP
jgi:hypothetical protein